MQNKESIQTQLSGIGIAFPYAKPGRQWRPLEPVVVMAIFTTWKQTSIKDMQTFKKELFLLSNAIIILKKMYMLSPNQMKENAKGRDGLPLYRTLKFLIKPRLS